MARSSLPDWPALMRRPTAASYCDMTASEFEREVGAGRLPLPTIVGGKESWQRRTLDEALERICGNGAADWRARQKLYAQG